MKTKSILFTAILFTNTLFNIFGQVKPETVKLFMTETGSTEQFKQLDAMFKAKIEEKKASFETLEQFELFSKIMTEGFSSANAEKSFTKYVIENANEDSLKNIIALYQQPLFKKIQQAELKANDPANQQELITFFQNLANNPPTQERIQQIVQLDKEIGSTEMTLKIINNLIVSMANGVNLSLPKEKQLPESEISAKISASLPENFAQQMNQQIIGMSICSYKDISDEELNQYIQAWSTPLGHYHTSLLFGGFDYSFSEMGKEMGNSFSKLGKN